MKATFHRNLNAKAGNAWSFVRDGKATQAANVFACNVSVKQPSGKLFAKCLQGGKRGVFAWMKSSNVMANVEIEIPANAVRIRFNPKNGDKFFHVDGQQIDFMRQVFCVENGECWAIL